MFSSESNLLSGVYLFSIHNKWLFLMFDFVVNILSMCVFDSVRVFFVLVYVRANFLRQEKLSVILCYVSIANFVLAAKINIEPIIN